jgi:hypothetical protein
MRYNTRNTFLALYFVRDATMENVERGRGSQREWSVRHTERHHTYHWTVECNGARRDGFLTYLLKRPTGDFRRTLGVAVDRVESIRSWLTSDDYGSLQSLENSILLKRKMGLGRSGSAKAVVLDIFHDRIQPPNPEVDIAVHKFGAVPIYVMPGVSVPLEIFGQQQHCQIGIYVDAPEVETLQEDSQRGYRGRPVNSLELLRTLRIRPDLTFSRYLEDVGEYTYKLLTMRNWSYVFRYGRKIEDLLDGSLDSKIETVLRYAKPTDSLRHTGIEAAIRDEAREYRDDFARMLCKYSMSRTLYLFILNHLYRAVGKKDECDLYGKQYLDSWKLFFSSLDDRKILSQTDQEARDLDAIWGAWHTTDRETELAGLRNDSRPIGHWLPRLIDFAHFTSRILSLKTNPETTKLFFSHRHTEDMKHLRQEVSKDLFRHFAGKVELLHVESRRSGFPFAEQVPPQIWLSDALVAVYSDRPQAGPQDDEDWVSREIALAQRFKLPLRIVREKFVVLSEISKRLEREGFSQAANLVTGTLIPELPEDLKERIQVLGPDLVETAQNAIKKKCQTLLVGFLLSIHSDMHVRIICEAHLASVEPSRFGLAINENQNIHWIRTFDLAKILKVRRQSLLKALRAILKKDRALSFPNVGAEIPPLVMYRGTESCRGNLLSAMEILRSDLSGRMDAERELRDHLTLIMEQVKVLRLNSGSSH